MTPTRHILQIILFISALSAGLQSCFKRELEHEENYINIKQDPSIADNEVLRFRTFKLDDYDRYIIFGNNNEVSIDGTAQLPLLLYYEGLDADAERLVEIALALIDADALAIRQGEGFEAEDEAVLTLTRAPLTLQ